MRTFWASPCEEPPVSCPPFPCLAGSVKIDCPMNRAACDRLRRSEGGMYDLGYPYAAWVVRKDPLDLFPTCSLEYFRYEPTEQRLREIYGEKLLHYCPANPRK